MFFEYLFDSLRADWLCEELIHSWLKAFLFEEFIGVGC